MAFEAVIELSALDGTTGFRISGVAAGDQSGVSVARAGDINGDGIDDFIIGATGVDLNGNNAGASYVVFGRNAAVDGAFAGDLQLSALDGTNGFRISGVASYDNSGWSVASAGDINGDGIDDLIIGARYAAPNDLYHAGASYVVFGRNTAADGAFASNLDLSALDGTNGFRISGEWAYDTSGQSVASAGDVNGDGIDDLIIGAFGADGLGAYNAGASFVVFGRNTATDGNFAADLNLGALNGTNGFRITGEAQNDNSGVSVASAGDVNGDGVGDLIIGAKFVDANGLDSGAAYVVFGRDTATDGNFVADFNLADLDGTNGFRLSGEASNDQAGWSVSAAGDVNGDGIADLIIGATTADPNGVINGGASYVVFGSNAGFAANLNLSALDGTSGFRISGAAAADESGFSVASAGDVNGDGFDDLIIGAWRADPNGMYSGASYVVFGRASGFVADLDLSTLDGTNGFRIDGGAAYDFSGHSVAAAGDINGDGVDDLIVGAFGAGPNGAYSGASYVIYGRLPAPVVFAGTPGNDTGSGGAGADQLSGLGGNDVLNGLGGDDLLDGGDLADLLYGGDGHDELIGGGGGDTLFGEDGDDTLDGGEGADKLFGGIGGDLLDGGEGNDRLEGGDGVDTLLGRGGNDHLDGGAGADVMTGGTGNDVYIVDDAGDQTIELADEGYDIVRTDLGWTLSDNIECLQLQGATDASGTGNALANNLQGNSGANILSGLAGVDTINGGDGDDIIIGGEGNDLLRGGSGADVFVVAHGFGATLETDQVYDFTTADGDIIDLSGVDADILTDGDQAFSLVSSFTKAAGEMTLTFAAGQTTLRLDVNGDGKPDYQMKINGDVTGDFDGWML